MQHDYANIIKENARLKGESDRDKRLIEDLRIENDRQASFIRRQASDVAGLLSKLDAKDVECRQYKSDAAAYKTSRAINTVFFVLFGLFIVAAGIGLAVKITNPKLEIQKTKQ